MVSYLVNAQKRKQQLKVTVLSVQPQASGALLVELRGCPTSESVKERGQWGVVRLAELAALLGWGRLAPAPPCPAGSSPGPGAFGLLGDGGSAPQGQLSCVLEAAPTLW